MGWFAVGMKKLRHCQTISFYFAVQKKRSDVRPERPVAGFGKESSLLP